MQYFTYIIKSKFKDRYYIGETDNIQRRIILHNEGNSISTKAYIPWELVYFEVFKTKAEALKREKQLKKMKSKKYIEWLIANHSRGRPPALLNFRKQIAVIYNISQCQSPGHAVFLILFF